MRYGEDTEGYTQRGEVVTSRCHGSKILDDKKSENSLNKTTKVVSVGCVGLSKHNGVLSEFGKIRETGKMCHVMSIDE